MREFGPTIYFLLKAKFMAETTNQKVNVEYFNLQIVFFRAKWTSDRNLGIETFNLFILWYYKNRK